jgi:hypothetical protein
VTRWSVPTRGDDGSAVADFALVSGLLVVTFLAVVQLVVAIHVRNTLVAAAAEGARVAGEADRSLADGEARTRALIGGSLPSSFGSSVSARYLTAADGTREVEVAVTAPLPLVGLAGPSAALTVTAHALREGG